MFPSNPPSAILVRYASRGGCLSAGLIWFALALVPAAQAETWINLNGTKAIEADLVGLWNDNAILEISGKRYTVPMTWFRSDSRIQAQNLWEKIKQDRRTRAEEFRGQASAAGAPAPDPIPTPPSPPEYQPPIAGTSCQDFLRHLDSQLAAGHVLVIYDSLPPQYRRDVAELTQLAAAQINPTTWRSALGSLEQLGELLVTRQNWFFSNPRIEALEASQPAGLRERLLLVGGLLRQGFDPQRFDPDTVQSADFR